jgi:hypothetical protein
LARHAANSEDDAEQALREIAAAQDKLTGRRHDSVENSSEKRMKERP